MLRHILSVVLVGLAVAPMSAQCGLAWLPGTPLRGIQGVVHALATYDPDGAGPLPPRVFAGGSFRAAGGALAANVAVLDTGTGTWQALGSGIDGTVLSLAVMPNGDVVAGGAVQLVGGTPSARLARWDGSTWSSLGSCNQSVWALAVLPNGDLVAGGSFTTVGGVAAAGLARWNGVAWSSLGGGVSGSVLALLAQANGDLVVGGSFLTSGGVTTNSLARWDGAAWQGYGAGIGGNSQETTQVRALALAANGDLLVGGMFLTAGSVLAFNLARWDGTAFATFAPGLDPNFGSPTVVHALAVATNGDVVVGGAITAAGGCA